MLARERCGARAFSQALEALSELQPAEKRALLAAGARCIAGDDLVRPVEAERLRTLATVLETPVPAVSEFGADGDDL